MALARLLGKEYDIARTLAKRDIVEYMEGASQLSLFSKETADHNDEPVTNELDLLTTQQVHIRNQ
ncbi:MAG: hypothetical protein KatS3mg055_3101 [Chloroflexus sp.]|nr:MAG: hypothetical protein KatS3mg055_3101 [Chloroflexus sp.]